MIKGLERLLERKAEGLVAFKPGEEKTEEESVFLKTSKVGVRSMGPVFFFGGAQRQGKR